MVDKNLLYNFDVILNDCVKLTKKINVDLLKNKTILITGSNGLIGGFLSDFCCFLNDNFDAKINIYLTSYSDVNNAERIKHIINRDDVKYFSWDCSTKIDTNNLSEKIDTIFFCSGYGQPAKFLENKIKTALINVVGLESLLKIMYKNGGGDFLFLSTSEIYGNPPDDMLPTPETYGGLYDLKNNRAVYNVSKTMGEVICKEYDQFDSMNIKIARVALTYGPGALKSDTRVLQEFIFKASRGGQINMFDEGSSIRNYLYIVDSIEILINCLFLGKYLVYNVGGDTEPVSIYELAKKIGEIIGAPVYKGKSKVEFTKTAPKNVGLDMRRFRKEFLNYGNDLINLEDGINNVIKWYNI